MRRTHYRSGAIPCKVVECRVGWLDEIIPHGDPDPIHEMVTVGFRDDLDPRNRSTNREFAQSRLASGMEVCLGVFDQTQRTGWRQERSHHWQNVRQPKPNIGTTEAPRWHITRSIERKSP